MRAARKFWRAARAALVFAVVGLLVAQLSAAPSALAQGQATPAPDDLVKFVILSRHGVRSPIPSPAELATWTPLRWPQWHCRGGLKCGRGELTLQGHTLAWQMGQYYRGYLARLLPPTQCPSPDQLFFWADRTERTEQTGHELLKGFRPSCNETAFFHEATASPDRIFHPVGEGSCTLDPERAEHEIMARIDEKYGSLSDLINKTLGQQLGIAQRTLECCNASTIPTLCQTTWKKCQPLLPKYPDKCTLNHHLPSCLVRSPPDSGKSTRVLLGGALGVASTFSEILLLEYANGFPESQVGWKRIHRNQLKNIFLLHATVFDLEQRTKYIAKRQGSLLLKKILLALEGENDGEEGTAPANAKFVAFVGHDTNIANVAAMLHLSWQQDGYQPNQTPPAGALVFELHSGNGQPYVSVSYVAQSLDDMHNATGTSPKRTDVPITKCANPPNPIEPLTCPLSTFEKLVEQRLNPDCSQ